MARVLVIDDNAVNLDLMLYLLRSFGHQVDGCSDGISGLTSAQSNGYDIVLADILMPGIDGYEFALRFKRNPALQAIPLVAVTALAMPGDREQVTQAGFNGYITKPIEPRTFVLQVEAFLT
ncbi:MAG TPA: response regulator [Candidatus Acidoferrales bacterium]|nr:response regulator [Candidatus Acidoferrales bacterium]